MTPRSTAPAQPSRMKAARPRSGFTLLEMLLVVAVTTLIVTIATFSLQKSLASQQVNAAAFRLSGDLTHAAQLAITRNQTIAVVFLRDTDLLAPKDKEPQFRGWQLQAANPLTGKLEPLAEPSLLDAGIIFMNHRDFSSLLHRPESDGEPSAIRFKPAGGTDLPTGPDRHWCLTLALEVDAEKDPATLPPSSRTAVVNAHTGMVTVY